MSFDACSVPRVRQNVKGSVALYVIMLGFMLTSNGTEPTYSCDLYKKVWRCAPENRLEQNICLFASIGLFRPVSSQ